jgi:predicted PurR-regulated permease PerM
MNSEPDALLHAPRRPLATYSPFRLGVTSAIGFGLAYLLFRALEQGRGTLILIALALFLAAGLDPFVERLERLGMRRAAAVGLVFGAVVLFLVGVAIAVVPPLADQITTFAHQLPGYVTQLQQNRRIASLDRRFGVLSALRRYVNDTSAASGLAGNLITVGTRLAESIFQVFSVSVMTLYFLAYLHDITGFLYRITPASRRPAARTIGDSIMRQIGRYVSGTAALSLIAATATLLLLTILQIPDPFALAFVVAVLSLAPLVGSALAAGIVSIVVLLESVPSGITMIVFFAVYAAFQHWLLTPHLLHQSVRISPAAGIVGAVAGYTMLGIIGFLVSIPLVAVVTLILREVVLPRQAAR